MVVRNGPWLGKEANDVSVGRRLGVISAPSISISAPACTQQCAMAAADLHAAQAVLPNKQLSMMKTLAVVLQIFLGISFCRLDFIATSSIGGHIVYNVQLLFVICTLLCPSIVN